jgi:hypothetical protein
MAVGRISGPLLKSNLVRNGIDLAFETDLLYLDVNNQKIGIKTVSPQHELDVNGTTRTTNLTVTNRADIGDVTVQGNTISTDQNFLNLGTLDTVVYQNKLRVDSIDIEGNVISTNSSNANLELAPNGTGTVEILSNMNVTGNLHATGNITADGDITLGDADTDNIVLNAEIASDIVPDATNTYSLGTDPTAGGKQWADIWVNNAVFGAISSTSLQVNGIDLTLKQGNIYYVAENGDDGNDGDHPQSPYASIKYALSQVTAGDTIHIYPGDYTEAFPMTVPVGVTVKGHSIRSVNISPTAETRYNDAFLMNGESTVEDLTVKDFYSGGNYFTITEIVDADTFKVNVGTTDQAHTYVSGGTVDFSDSTAPVNVDTATYNESTGVLEITTVTPHDSYVGHSVFISGLVFSCSGDNRTFPDNGYAFRFATDFKVTTRSPYIRNITVLTAGSTTTAEDPRGFNAGDAGKGALIDGAYATADSKEASMLFHSATFICPGVEAIRATNGVRIEWLNSFTYFADKGIYAFDSVAGFAYDGKTRVRLSGLGGAAPAALQTVTFTSTDSSTVIGPLTIEDVEDSDILVLDGKQTDLLDFDTTPQSIAFSGGGSATTIENVDVRDFGAEIRMIGSAAVYGNYGLYGDGEGVIVYAIGQNLAYIGVGKEVTNDEEEVIQENEVVELNNAKIRYNSVDHKGDFRVGELFFVDQDTGSVSFVASALNIDLTTGATFTTGGDTTFISGERIDTGNLRISGNTIESLAGNVNFNAASDLINLNNNVNITGDLDVTGNVTIGGNITVGNDPSDTINIVAGIESDLVPSETSTYSLGSAAKTWSNLYINEADIDGIKITQNYVTTTESNADLDLRANGTGNVVVPSNDVQIDQDLTVDGTATLANTNITGTVTLVGDFNQTGDTTVTGDVTVDQDMTVGAAAQFEEILVDDNFITTTSSNTDLELRANGTGQILVPNNNVTVNNDLTVNGATTTVDIVSTGLITADSFTNNTILIDNNVVETTAVDTDLILRANGTGVVNVPSNDVQMSQNLDVTGNITVGNNVTITGTLTVNDINSAGTIQANNFTTGDILIDDNFITTTNSNSDLELRAAGTGSIVIDDFSIKDGTITTTGDMTFTPGTGIVDIDSTGALKLPVGTTAERPSASAGQIRFNIETAQFEGYDGTNWIRLNGVQDLDGNTRITAELTPGANDNTIRFYINGTAVADIDATRLNTNRVTVDDIEIDGNVISTTTTNTDLQLQAQGTGSVVLENFAVNNNTITNTSSGAVFTFANTGTGYVDISGTSGVVLPIGDDSQRPTGVTGMIRFNTEDNRVELYDGSDWVSVAGAAAGINIAQAEEIAIEQVLIFG